MDHQKFQWHFEYLIGLAYFNLFCCLGFFLSREIVSLLTLEIFCNHLTGEWTFLFLPPWHRWLQLFGMLTGGKLTYTEKNNRSKRKTENNSWSHPGKQPQKQLARGWVPWTLSLCHTYFRSINIFLYRGTSVGVLKERGNKQAVLVCLVSWKVLNCSNAAGASAEHTALREQLSLSLWGTVSVGTKHLFYKYSIKTLVPASQVLHNF